MLYILAQILLFLVNNLIGIVGLVFSFIEIFLAYKALSSTEIDEHTKNKYKYSFFILLIIIAALFKVKFDEDNSGSLHNFIEAKSTAAAESATEVSETDNTEKSTDKEMVIPEDARVLNGHSYYLYTPSSGTWDDVLSDCVSKGGYPAVINTSEENEFLFNYMKDSGLNAAFIGYTDKEMEGSWKWVYGEKSDFTDWGKNSRGHQEPNHESDEEDWAQMDGRMREGHWNDCKYGQDTYAYFCEWDGVR